MEDTLQETEPLGEQRIKIKIQRATKADLDGLRDDGDGSTAADDAYERCPRLYLLDTYDETRQFPAGLDSLTVEVDIALRTERIETVIHQTYEGGEMKVATLPTELASQDDEDLPLKWTLREVVMQKSDADALQFALDSATWNANNSPLGQWIQALRTLLDCATVLEIKELLAMLLQYGQLERALALAHTIAKLAWEMKAEGHGIAAGDANQQEALSESPPMRHFWMFVLASELLDADWHPSRQLEQKIHALDWCTPMEKQRQQEEEHREELRLKEELADRHAKELIAAQEKENAAVKENSKSRKKIKKKAKKAAGKKKAADEGTNAATTPAPSVLEEAEEAPPTRSPSPSGKSWTIVEKSKRRPLPASRPPPLSRGSSLTTPLPAPLDYPHLSKPPTNTRQ
ncbi:hypothetical protein H2199_006115 [Coniosporium tulheliwenetii]|uniref:Uncharacterized protein n=1 Tax=Coniosporium tulheliwenetii TaxID=3383036 RepID=A0ACC2YX52_9PEZI|nr:hypothetical protein H2199_006115 [Cladosporium sp. JES 115]